MAFFSGTDDRRRRVLTEQVLAAPAAALDRAATTGKPSYASAALDGQSRLTDFVPRRYSTILVVLLLQSLVVVGLLALYVYAPDWNAVIAEPHRVALDLNARSSLAGWFTSLTLAMAAVASLVIYSVRRHKTDDYQGRYRVWLWAGVGFIMLSANAVAGVHLLLADVLTHLTGWPTNGQIFWWWLGPALLLVLGAGLRMSFELRRCRLALCSWLAAIACWGTFLATQFGLVTISDGAVATMVSAGSALASLVMLWTGVSLYARYVVLDAGGAIPVRKRKIKKEKPQKPNGGGAVASGGKSKDVRIDSAHNSKPQSVSERRSDLVATGSSDAQSRSASGGWVDGSDDDEYEDDEDAGGRRLSKAERKQLRRQRVRDQRAERR